MLYTKAHGTIYDRKRSIILTRLCGAASTGDIDAWGHSLREALSDIPDGASFRILVDLYGFTAGNFETHKYFRTIIPVTLAQYGWKVGYVDLFEQQASMLQYSTTRGISCTAAAHVHHDATKIDLYQSHFSTSREGFFTNTQTALRWLLKK